MKAKRNKSQVAVEYLLLLAMLLVVFLAAFANEGSPLRTGIKSFINGLGTSISGIIK